jgi:hypothetical protein
MATYVNIWSYIQDTSISRTQAKKKPLRETFKKNVQVFEDRLNHLSFSMYVADFQYFVSRKVVTGGIRDYHY